MGEKTHNEKRAQRIYNVELFFCNLAVLLVVLLENLLGNSAADGTVLARSLVAVVALIKLNAQFIGYFVLHLIECTVLLCHCLFTTLIKK